MNGFLSHKKISGYICAFLAATLVCLGCTSCDGKPTAQVETGTSSEQSETEESAPQNVLRLPYSSEDSLNPFFMKSLMNSSFVGLIYRSLYYVNSSVTRVRDLAVSETVSDTSVRVNAAPEAQFSDGSSVTAQDIVYSFGLAKNSYLYSQELSGISQASAIGNHSVEFTLVSPDVFSLNSLFFPIVKQNTAGTADALPTGTGRYIYSGTEGGYVLKVNTYADSSPKVGEIELKDVKDDASLVFKLETGITDACFSDLSEGEASRINAASVNVFMNNLVYIGFNPGRAEFLRPEVRRAFSLLTDRSETVESAFYSRAGASVLPVHPAWSETLGCEFAQTLSDDANINDGVQLLTEAGFAGVSGYGIRYSGDISMQYTLLYCSDTPFKKACAEITAKNFTAQGIVTTLKGLPYNEYVLALKNGEYDIYLGEVVLPYSMSLAAFFSPDGAVYCGDCISPALAASYAGWRSGKVTADIFLRLFYTETPFIPLCFRNGVMCYSRSIKSSVTASRQNPYENISEWTVN